MVTLLEVIKKQHGLFNHVLVSAYPIFLRKAGLYNPALWKA